MRYLSVSSDAKTIKGQKKGYLTGILYLAPSNTSGVADVCVNASEGCKASCLFTAGRASIFPMINQARIRKTRELFADRNAFVAVLEKEISAVQRKADRMRLTPCIRLNGTSDLPWLALKLADRFPEVQFYDYTKHPQAYKRTRANYHLTFSHSETNTADCLDNLKNKINVAVAFDTKRGQPLPKTWQGYRVIDGDVSDLRFTDRRGVVVGLRAKGLAKKDCTGFVVRSQSNSNLVQIGSAI